MSHLFRDVEGKALCPQGSVVCIGAFDGLHRGHQALVGHAHARARALNVQAVALSFEPLPREFFAPENKPPRLLLPRAKFQGLSALGMDVVGLLRFDTRLTAMSADDFIARILVARLAAREVWVGPEFRFGKGRGGDLAVLVDRGLSLGFVAGQIKPVQHQGERVSSSRLRLQLQSGDLDGAAQILGHRYAISGKVVHGRKLGRQLGFPTANVRLLGKTPALSGVYATWVHGVGDVPVASVSSLGTRPTINGTEPLLETYLFDFGGELYGRRINVEFVAKLRDEVRFDGLTALTRQMQIDSQQAREILLNDQIDIGVSA